MKKSNWYALAIIVGWFWMLILTILLSAYMGTKGEDFGWFEVVFILISASAFSILTEPVLTFVRDIDKSTKNTKGVKNNYVGREVIVFDYELYDRIGDIGDNEFFWKKGVVVGVRKYSDGCLLDIKTEDGRLLEDIGTDNLRNWQE